MSKTQSKSTAKNLVAGGVAGAIEATINFPTEFVKTQMQLQESALRQGTTTTKPFKGPIDVAVRTVREKGFFGLYRGLSTLIIGSAPKASIRFAGYQKAKNFLSDGDPRKVTSMVNLCSGLFAGVAEALFAVTPMETVKTKLIHDQNSAKPKYRGLIHGVGLMIREEGFRGIYKGVGPTTFKQATNQGIRFTIYGKIKLLVQRGDPTRDLKLYQSFMAGSLTGAISCYCNMPLDVVKTRMQGLEAAKYGNSIQCFRSILDNEGILALWKGTVPRLARLASSGAILFAGYEQTMKGLSTFWPEPED